MPGSAPTSEQTAAEHGRFNGENTLFFVEVAHCDQARRLVTSGQSDQTENDDRRSDTAPAWNSEMDAIEAQRLRQRACGNGGWRDPTPPSSAIAYASASVSTSSQTASTASTCELPPPDARVKSAPVGITEQQAKLIGVTMDTAAKLSAFVDDADERQAAATEADKIDGSDTAAALRLSLRRREAVVKVACGQAPPHWRRWRHSAMQMGAEGESSPASKSNELGR